MAIATCSKNYRFSCFLQREGQSLKEFVDSINDICGCTFPLIISLSLVVY